MDVGNAQMVDTALSWEEALTFMVRILRERVLTMFE
jgi:hypothetical protein